MNRVPTYHRRPGHLDSTPILWSPLVLGPASWAALFIFVEGCKAVLAVLA